MSGSVKESLESLGEAVNRLKDSGDFSVRTATGAFAMDDLRWTDLDRMVDAQLEGRRVLDLGREGSHDALEFAARGADYVLACTRSDASPEADRIGAEHSSRVEFRRSGWEALDPERDGIFDVVHCHGLLHRVLEPMTMLRTLHRMTAGDGELLISSMVLADPERSEFLRFVPDRHAGDASCWFVPGGLAFRGLVETAGFDVAAEFGEREGPRDGFPVMTRYLRAWRRFHAQT